MPFLILLMCFAAMWVKPWKTEGWVIPPLQSSDFVANMEKVLEVYTRIDWALFMEEIANQYFEAEKITLVMDSYDTHKAGALYEAFAPEKAKAIWDRFEFVYTPKHGNWLNMAEIELNVLMGQCLNRRDEKTHIKST
jgi:hypothetical protein